MKRFFSLLITVSLLVSVGLIHTSAEAGTGTASAEITVSIIDAGTIVAAQRPVTVTDIDGDALLTVNDALHATHEVYYPGGAAAGYGSEIGQFGLALTKLWGDTSGCFGYQLNHESCMSLTDSIQSGDYLVAYVYQDKTSWSDTYAYFDINNITLLQDDTMALTLYTAGYDSSFQPVKAPLAGAVITINGIATPYITDEFGNVLVRFSEVGTLIVSATKDDMTLIPPIFLATVYAYENPTATEPATTPVTEDVRSPIAAESNPLVYLGIGAAVLAAAIALTVTILVAVKKHHIS